MARAGLAILDLTGILAIGFVLTSTAVFLTLGSSPGRVIEFGGLSIPAVTAQTLPLVILAILIAFLAKALFSAAITKSVAFLVATTEARAAKAIAERVFGGELGQVRSRSKEETAYAIQFGSPAAFNSLLNYASTIVAEGSLFILVCVGFLLIDPLSTLVAAAYLAIIATVIQYFIGTLMGRAGLKATTATIEANGAVADLIAVFRELSVLGLRAKYINRIYRARLDAAESAATQIYLNGMPRYIVETALLLGIAGFIASQAASGDLISSASTIGVFLTGGFRLTAAMLPLQAALLNIKGQVAVAKVAHQILFDSSYQAWSLSNGGRSETNRQSSGKLEPLGAVFKGVSFQYPGALAPAIHNLSFEIKPGEQVAFIGSSGAGKSTIADLMTGLLKPNSGAVKLGTADISSPAERKLPVSYVPQKPGLVSGSVVQNVALGEEVANVDLDRVWQALGNANLDEVVRSLPQKMETNLGNHQDGLSGGQIQRLGLARALYSKPGLLIMDEATSALDAESEAEIAKALNQMRGKVTVVLIAHRLNTVQHADRVFFIDQGRVQDEGTFKELLARNPSIERLVQLMKVDEG